MKIKFTRAPTLTKAVIAAVGFTIVFLATASNLPSCSDPAAAFNAGGCVERQSYLHTASGWLALASLITGVVLFILKQRKSSAEGQQVPAGPPRFAAPGPAGAPRPTETTMSDVRTHGDAIGQASSAGLSRSPGPGQAANFCAQCGTRAVPGDNFCQQCGAPVKTEPEVIR